jgi:hypothetical protein
MVFFIRPSAAAVLSALPGEKTAGSSYHKKKKKEKAGFTGGNGLANR